MPQPPVTSTQGPWRRVVDTARQGKPDPESLRDLLDGVLLPTGAIASRPGSQVLAAHPSAPGEAQGLACLELAGTTYTLAVVGGVLASYDWTADAWTRLAHAGATISVTGPVALVAFFDQLVVSDGVNKPWATTVGSGTGAYLPTSGAWYGLPVVKDAKLEGVLAGDRRTLVWSEEADLTIGFDVAPYNDAWDLRQQSQAALVAVRASNTALVYQREHSTGQILGAVNDDFQASGTHDDVCARGTLSPFASVLDADGRLWSVDSLGRPYRVAPGTAVDDLWLACDATTSTVDRDRLYAAWGGYLADTDTVVLALARDDALPGVNSDLLHFDRTTGDYVGRWRVGSDHAWGAVCAGDDGVSRLVVLSATGVPTVVWTTAEADRDATKALDVSATGAALVPTRAVLAEAQAEGADQAARIQWTGAIIETGDPTASTVPPVLSAVSSGTTLTYACETPGHGFHPLRNPPITVTVGPSGRKKVGTQRWGRWLRSAFAATAGGGSERFRLWRVTWIGSVRDAADRAR